jgi:hypothetical protein
MTKFNEGTHYLLQCTGMHALLIGIDYLSHPGLDYHFVGKIKIKGATSVIYPSSPQGRKSQENDEN